MCVCVCLWEPEIFFNHSSHPYIYICTCIYTCMYIRIHTHVYIHTHIYIQIYVCVWMCIYVHVHTYIYTYMCVCTYIYIHTYTYTYTHTCVTILKRAHEFEKGRRGKGRWSSYNLKIKFFLKAEQATKRRLFMAFASVYNTRFLPDFPQ